MEIEAFDECYDAGKVAQWTKKIEDLIDNRQFDSAVCYTIACGE